MRNLIVAFSCLLLVVQCEAAITSIESSTLSSTNDIGVSNGPGEVNEVELAKQEKRLQLRRKAEVKKWRKLKSGMTEKQVRRILRKPKLIQSGSDECTWFYQYLPNLNAKEKVNGTVTFKAKTIEELIAEEKAKHIKKVEKLNERFRTKRYKGRRYNGKPYYFYNTNNRDPYYYSYEVGYTPDHYSLPEIRVSRRESDDRQAELAKRARFEGQFKELINDYERAVKRLSDRRGPKSPVFRSVSFNQPDWPQIEYLLTRGNACMITAKDAKDKWNLPHKWRKLKINMTVNEVHRLLGQPERSETNMQGRKEYYGDVSGHGELYFSVCSNLEECLDSWIEPFWPAIENSLRADKTSSEENIDQ